jgi:hypothetical protein
MYLLLPVPFLIPNPDYFSSANSPSLNMPMPLASLVHNQFLAEMAKERGDLEWAASVLEVSEAAGVK